MALNSLENEWQGFAKMVLPANASAVQRAEMRKAFIAGAYTVLTNLQEIGQDHISEIEGVAHLESIKKECEAFQRQMMHEYGKRN